MPKYNIDVVLEPESEPIAPSPAKKKLVVQAKVREAPRPAKKKPVAYDSDEDEELNFNEEQDECCKFQPTTFPSYSSSYRQLDLITGSHEYVINGFSLYRYMGCGMRLCSDFFDAGGQLFRLEVYPGGFNPGVSQYLSVFLTSPAPFNPNQIMYEVAIVDQSGEGRFIQKRDLESKRKCGCRNTSCCCHGGHYSMPMMSQGRGIVVSIPKMANVKELEAKCRDFLPCDTLTIRATVSMIQAGWKSPPAIHSSAHSPLGAYSPAFPPAVTIQPVAYPGYASMPPPVPYHLPHQPTMMAANVPAAGYYPSSPPPPPFQVIHTVPVSDHSAQYQQAVSYQQPMQEYYSSGPAAAQVPAQPGSMSAQDQQYLVYMSTPPQ